ncbi:flagellar assembly protein FliH [Aquibacillus koreensis]|uniref:Flagellar assembly protein FliH n=1 Tax=Aquibacillus koreensis TaxID=279446 RepID=A0A9X4AKX4_9BACI|nr:flagellar assembly protein FliH [Aquibacillus koreensis]MCT2534521.1 flagellar assembly protein FliH [Aquibacillus koreensis]MDC3421885.1 flagellar assembly protein FliH [Aquibacillus koreensis]
MSSVYRYDDPLSQRKIISIKPVISKNTPIGQEDPVDELSQLKAKLEQAKQQLAQVREEADHILEQARQQVAIEREQWEKEKNHLMENAKQTGYQEGFELGRNESIEKHKELIEQARSTINLAKKDYHLKLEQSEEEVLQLALKAASKIMHHSIEESEHFLHIVKDVLKEVKEQHSVQITAHPEDYQVMFQHKDELENIVSSKTEFSIYPDHELQRGSCIIETPFGKIDASLDSQLQELRNKLFHLSREVGHEHS